MKDFYKKFSRDKILGGQISILQPKDGFRVGTDSLLLASSIKSFSDCLELGSGAGVISICLAKRNNNAKIIGIENDDCMVELAHKNLLNNNLHEKNVNFLCIDIMSKEFNKMFNNKFDRVVMNPPYFSSDSVHRSKNYRKAIAKYSTIGSLEKWIEVAYKKLITKGYLNFIYRTNSLTKVLGMLAGNKWGDIRILPLWPKIKIESKLFIIQARKNVKTGSKILPGLVLHNEDGSFSDACNNILLNRDLLQMS